MPRIFIALPVDAAVRRTIAGAIPKEDGAVRWVKEHQYHITLKFLGEISEHELQQTCAAVEQVGRAWTEPLHLAVRGVGAFPNTARARVVWVGITGDVGPLLRLQRSVEQALVGAGFPAERRPFTPHVTVGRLRDPGPLPEAVLAYENFNFGTWTVPAVQVVESTLRPAGPVYTVRHEVALPVSAAT